jgi:hypothetical protein
MVSKRIDRGDAEVKGTLTATVSMAVDDLSDVTAPTPSNGDALTWNTVAGKWVNAAGSGGVPTQITVAAEATEANCRVMLATKAAGDIEPKTNDSIQYNALTHVLSVNVTGSLTGNCSGSSGTCVGNAGTVTNGVYTTDTGTVKATMLQAAAADLGDADVNVVLSNSHAGRVTNLTIDGTLTASTGVSGALTGNVTGDCTGSSGSCTGNAVTATTASQINPTDESSDTTCFPVIVTAATGAQVPHTDASFLTYNANTGAMCALRFNGLADAQVLTSAADTTLTLDTTYASDLLVTGTAVMYVLNLGDARTYTTGKRFTVYNNTPEFVGVLNSDATVWHRVPPRAKCHCILADGTAAAGVWWSETCETKDPAAGWSAVYDSGTTATGFLHGEAGLITVTSGTAAGVNMTNTNMTIGGRQGVYRLYAGTAATGYALGYNQSGGYSYLGSGCRAFTASVGFCAISTATEEYIGRVGIGDNITGGAHTEGCYFLYDRLGVDIHWQVKGIKTAGGAANTVVDTAIAPLYSSSYDYYQRLRGEVSSAGTRFDAFINTTQVTASGGITNIPLTSTAIRPFEIGITGSAYSAATRIMYTDYHWLQSYPTTLR